MFALRARLRGSHPLISAAPGQRAAQGLIKSPAAIRGPRCLPREQGPATTALLGVRPRGRIGEHHSTAGPSLRPPGCRRSPALLPGPSRGIPGFVVALCQA